MKIHNAKFGLVVKHKESKDIFRVLEIDEEASPISQLLVTPIGSEGVASACEWVNPANFKIYKGEIIDFEIVQKNQIIYVKDTIEGIRVYLGEKHEKVLNKILKRGYGLVVSEGVDKGQVELCYEEGGVSIWVETEYLKQPRSPIPMLGI